MCVCVCVCVCVQVLGDRWAAICRWTEERWILLQEILLKWQHFTNEQVCVCMCVCVCVCVCEADAGSQQCLLHE